MMVKEKTFKMVSWWYEKNNLQNANITLEVLIDTPIAIKVIGYGWIPKFNIIEEIKN